MESERSDIDDQYGSNAEVTSLSEKLDIINVPTGGVEAFTVMSDGKVAVLIQNQLVLYNPKKEDGQDKGQFVQVSECDIYLNFDRYLRNGTVAKTLTNIGSSKLAVLCDYVVSAERISDYYTPKIPSEAMNVSCEVEKVTRQIRYQLYDHSLIKVYSIENGQLRFCFDMKTDMKKTEDHWPIALAYDNETLAILMTNPLKLELLNMTTCLSESVNMTSFVTDMFPVGRDHLFLSMSNSVGQTHFYISLAAGGGMRKLTKIDKTGHILATFVEVNKLEPGPIAAVGDGTLVFCYDRKILLMSDDFKILATLKTYIDVRDIKIRQTEKGRYMYCLEGRTISQYSLQ